MVGIIFYLLIKYFYVKFLKALVSIFFFYKLLNFRVSQRKLCDESDINHIMVVIIFIYLFKSHILMC